MSYAGVGKLHLVEGIMDSDQYINILKKNVKESARMLSLGRRFELVQDNDPKVG